MPRYHMTRSFAISMAIVIAVTQTSHGFTIRQNILDSTKDLDAGESSLVAITTNPVKLNEINMTIEGNTTVIALNKPNTDQKELDETTNISATDINDINTVTQNVNSETLNSRFLEINLSTIPTPTTLWPEKTVSTTIIESIRNKIENLTDTTQENYQLNENKTTDYNTNTILNTKPNDPDNIKQYVQSMTENIKNASKAITENINNVSKTITENLINVSQSLKENLQRVSQSRKEDFTSIFEPTQEEIKTNAQTADTQVTYQMTEDDVRNKMKLTTESTEFSSEEADTFTETSNLIQNDAVYIKNNDSSVDVPTTTETLAIPNENVSKTSIGTDTTPENDLHNDTKKSSQDDAMVTTTEYFTTVSDVETTTDNEYLTNLNSLNAGVEKQMAIAQENLVSDIDMMNAESAQTDVTINKTLDYTPTPMDISKENVNSEPMSSKSKNMTEYSFSELERMKSSEPSEVNDGITKVESSKRAGFLDNASTVEPKETTTVSYGGDNATFASVYETDEIEIEDVKNYTDVESQRQMAEDAIKEELLKEENINNSHENAKRVQEEITTAKDNSDYFRERPAEDELSVKPLGLDKRKMSDIYVPVNYKPLKKINVQPSKQLVRDPDDNSWRNESISSLGIVFKPKNASKSFKEVLKNKTETEFPNLLDKDNKNKEPQLKVRLEKIAEARKKKKKFNNSSTEYEESSEEIYNSNVTWMPPDGGSSSSSSIETSTPVSFIMPTETIEIVEIPDDKPKNNVFNMNEVMTTTEPTKKKKLESSADDYDEYADYMGMSKVDIKKSSQTARTKYALESHPELKHTSHILSFPDRQPTIQYFPPTTKATKIPSFKEYGDNSRSRDFLKYDTRPSTPAYKYGDYSSEASLATVPSLTSVSEDWKKIPPVTSPSMLRTEPNPARHNEPNFSRGSYVIKHYRDFINSAVLEDDGDTGQYNVFTAAPLHGLTTQNNPIKTGRIEDDYDNQFRKDIMRKFIENFNQNSERYKADFPVIYNNSVVHRNDGEHGKVAQSSALMKRLYEAVNPKPSQFLSNVKPCGLVCDNITLELSPAYELHYYVPEQEEREELDTQPLYNQR